MAFIDPQAEGAAVTDAVIAQLKTMFPYEGRKHDVVLTGLRAGESGDVDDLQGQKRTKITGRTWAAPLYADLELRNKEGKVVDRVKDYKILSLPRITSRLSYIVEGAETQVNYQWHLKAGAYARRKGNGELEAQFNVAGGPSGFRMGFSPQTRKYTLEYADSNIPLHSVLTKVFGVSEAEITKAWGPEIAAANKSGLADKHVDKLYKAMFDKTPESPTEAVTAIREQFAASKMYGDVNQITLKKPYSEVSSGALMAASGRLLDIARGTDEPDPRDALHFKDLWGVEDYLPKRLADLSRSIRNKIRNNIDRKDKISEIVHRDVFNEPVKSFFRTALAERSHQVNPIAMLADQRKTTIMGPMGGVQNEYAITIDDRLIDQSHVGFLDPIPSPEGGKTGITTYLPIGAIKRGRSLYTKMYNTKTGKLEELTPERAYGVNVAFPDQYSWDTGKPVPNGPLIKVNGVGNVIDEVKADKVDYILPSAQGTFTLSTNVIPFLQNDQGNRANYASKQISQAIPLVNREEPLVQVHTGTNDPKMTWERVIGKHFSASAAGDGVVTEIGDDFIRIRGADKKTYDVPMYRNYPLNDGKTGIDSTPLVKVGDKVTKGQTLADTSFTKNGVLSMGANVRIAYMPWKNGSTFEDGIVVSESLAKKMTSEHLMQERVYADKNYTLDRNRYRAMYPDRLTDEQAKKLDATGVVRVGQVVQPGDTLVAALRRSDPSKEQLVLRGLHKSLSRPYADASISWGYDYPGTVADVVRNGREVLVHVRTEAPLMPADKIAGRHGNKGTISAILPDADMPRDAQGKPVDMVFNPIGVAARINLGQVYETLLGKVAHAKGEPYAVTNFAGDPDRRVVQVRGHWRTTKGKDGTAKRTWVDPHERSYYHVVREELRAAGISDTEPLYDPKTGIEYKSADGKSGILTGYQYFLKLEHTAQKKLAARGQGAPLPYDANMAPSGGGDTGGQRIGSLGLYALLGHGDTTAIIREMNTVKSDGSQADFWAALQAGESLPPPKAPFAYQKFVGYLNALGVNVERKGDNLQLVPMTDKEILAKSNGAVTLNVLVRAKDLKPEKGGIFDEDLTGGVGGSGWSHAKVPEPVPNPLFEKAIASLTGLNLREYKDLVAGKLGLSAEGKLVPAEEAKLQAGSAIEAILKNVDVKKELAATLAAIPNASKANLDTLNKRAKYLRAVDRAGVRPEDVYLVHNIPVIPPKFRPMSVLEGGNLNVDDLNGLYQQIGILLQQLKTFPPGLPPEYKNELRAGVYDALESLAGLGGSLNEGTSAKKGILDIIAGVGSPKGGFFMRNLLVRKQDLTMRGVIIPGPELKLDQMGLPRVAAMEMLKPFVVRDLVKLGYAPNAAKQEVERRSPAAERSLDQVAAERPLLLKRDPALHKFSVMAFWPKLIGGKAIRLHPLATGGLNADFDGDTVSVYCPVTTEAVAQAKKMLPSENLFNVATGGVMGQPTLEAQVGLFLATRWGREGGKKYSDPVALLTDAKDKKLPYDEVVSLGGHKTTAGRVLVDSVLPKKMRGGPWLTDPKRALDKSGLQAMMMTMAKDFPSEFPAAIDDLKDIGFNHSHLTGMTLSMAELAPLSAARDAAFAKADEVVLAAMRKGVGKKALDEIRVKAYGDATKSITDTVRPALDGTNNVLYRMSQSGSKPSWDQIRQMIVSPVLLNDGHGRPIPIPVRSSYAEGMDLAEYWTAAHGARKGVIDKVVEVSEPGALSKMISAAVVGLTVTKDDCGASSGVTLPADSADVLDRFTAAPVRAGQRVIPANTAVTPEIQSALRGAGVAKLEVRSPMRCQATQGLCSHCVGLAPNGKPFQLRDNIGIMAGQSVGERAVQLAMKCSHEGSLVTVRHRNEDAQTVTFRRFWEMVDSFVDMSDPAFEMKLATGWQVWDVGGWTAVHTLQRHAPDAPMVAVHLDNGGAYVVQSDHPCWAREAVVACTECGGIDTAFVGRWRDIPGRPPMSRLVCVPCGARVDAETAAYEANQERIVLAGNLEGLRVRVSEAPASPRAWDHWLPPYLLGVFLAEGSVNRFQVTDLAPVGRKKRCSAPTLEPWKIQGANIAQHPGPVRDRIVSELTGAGILFDAQPHHLVLHDVAAGRSLWQCGVHSEHKTLPFDCAMADDDARAFLAGMLDGDGTVGEHRAAVLYSTSLALLSQCRRLCAQLGYVARLRATTNHKDGRNQSYKLTFYPTERLPSVKGHRVSDRRATPVRYATVTAVRPVMHSGLVYDMSTDSRSFVANGMHTHNSFHSGGVVGGKGAISGLDRLRQILSVPELLPGSATLAKATGSVESIKQDPAGGWRVQIGTESHYVPADRGEPTVKRGDTVHKGQALSAGPLHPQELLALSGVDSVQDYLAGAMESAYKGEGLKRRNFEVVAKAMTGLGHVDASGGHPDYLRGDLVSVSQAQAWNRENPTKSPVKVTPVLRGINTLPYTGTEDWMARMSYQRLKETLREGVARGWKSDLHGTHPTPGLAFGAEFGKPGPDKPWAY